MSALKEKWNSAGVVIFGITPDVEEGSCGKFAKAADNKVTYPLYRTSWVMKHYKIDFLPALIIYDGQGKFLRTIEQKLGAKQTPLPTLAEVLK